MEVCVICLIAIVPVPNFSRQIFGVFGGNKNYSTTDSCFDLCNVDHWFIVQLTKQIAATIKQRSIAFFNNSFE